jgi:hypothetical protein
MRVQGVDLPDDLIRAHAEGRLTLFVGAGASKAHPSNLPDFRELAERIAKETHNEAPPEESQLDAYLGEPPPPLTSWSRPPSKGSKLDAYLGELASQHEVDVHERVREHIANPDSRPNDLHRAIVNLALASNRPRIITTNYDRHLSTCLAGEADEDKGGGGNSGIREYLSLEFPMRDDFTGLVYLHGSVSEPASNLVVTAADFGRVYLTARWTAAQFLSTTFRNSTVLFIGYSHKDTLMKYLSLGLTAERVGELHRVYALCERRELPGHWEGLGIIPIGYDQHADLPLILQEWVEQSRNLTSIHKERVGAILQSSPPPTADDESYLEWILQSEEHRRLFTGQAKGVEWLLWAAQYPKFACIFNPSIENPPSEFVYWFSRNYTTDPETADNALELFRGHGSHFSPALWDDIKRKVGNALQDGDEATRQAAKRWIPLLLNHVPPNRQHAEPFLLYLLRGRIDPVRDPAETLLLLNYLFTPVASLPSSPLRDGELRAAEPKLRIHPRGGLTEWMAQRLVPALSDAQTAQAVAGLVDQKLRLAHAIAASNGDVVGNWKIVSDRRSAIEPHDQNRHPNRIDPLIDLAREALEALLEHHRELAGFWLYSWATSEIPLLRRLAIHGWAERQDVTPDEKIDWLIGNDSIFDRCVLHEAMRLLALASPDASEAAVARVVGLVAAGPIRDIDPLYVEDAEMREREVFEWLAWIRRHAPDSPAARQSFDDIQSAHEDWTPMEHPDLRSWIWVEFLTPPEEGPPYTLDPQELHAMIQRDPAELLDWLSSFPTSPTPERFRTLRGDALITLSGAIKTCPESGVALLDCLTSENSKDQNPLAQSVATAVLNAWDDAESDTLPYEEIVELLPRIWATGSSDWEEVPDSQQAPSPGWLSRARGHWAALTAMVALKVAKQERHAADHEPAQLADHLKALLETMLAESTPSANLAQETLAAGAASLFWVDSAWCPEHVVPLLDPTNDLDQAIRCWQAFLEVGEISAELLEAGLIESYISMTAHLDRMNRPFFHQHWAAIAFHCVKNPKQAEWIGRFTAKADPESRIQWMTSVRTALSELTSSEVTANWNTWMRPYWEGRLRSIPKRLTLDESAALAGWTPYLHNRFPEAVELVCEQATALPSDSHLMFADLTGGHFPEDGSEAMADVYPEATAQLLTHMMSYTKRLSAHVLHSALNDAIPRLLRRISPEQAALLREQAERLNLQTYD